MLILWKVFGGTELTVLAGVQEGKLVVVPLAWLEVLSVPALDEAAGKLVEGWTEISWEVLEA